MNGPTVAEALRRAAFDNTLTDDQARAVATILGVLDTILAGYSTEMGRLSRVYGNEAERRKGAAAARRRADVAARRAAEPDAVEQAPNVVRLRPDDGPDGAA